MFLILGKKIAIDKSARAICPVGEKYCLKCNKGTQHVLCRGKLWGTLFFLPTFDLGYRFGMRCSVCGKTSDFYVKKRKEGEILESLKKDGYTIDTNDSNMEH